MEEARDAWKEVGSRVEALGLKLKLHLEEEKDQGVEHRGEGDTQNAFEELGSKVTDAFDAFGDAAKDDAVHADVREIAELIKQALIETFQAVGAEVGDLIEQIEDYAEDAAERIADAVGFDVDLDGDDDDDDDLTRVTADPVVERISDTLDQPGSEVADEL